MGTEGIRVDHQSAVCMKDSIKTNSDMALGMLLVSSNGTFREPQSRSRSFSGDKDLVEYGLV